jgi:hypothetical protein
MSSLDKDQARRDKSENVVEKVFCDSAAFLNWAQLTQEKNFF